MYRTVFWTCERGRGWDNLGEWHWNMYNIIYEMNRQSRFDAWYWMLWAGALARPRGMVRGGSGEVGSGWGPRLYLWWIHVDIWQNQYNIVVIIINNNKTICIISFKSPYKKSKTCKYIIIGDLCFHYVLFYNIIPLFPSSICCCSVPIVSNSL